MEIDLFILGNTNINIFDNGNNSLEKHKDVSKRKSNFGGIPKKCAHICSTLGLKHPARITCHISILIDLTITNCEEKVTKNRVIDTSLSDHQLIFCTREIKRVNTNNHKQIFFRTLQNYTMKNCEQALKNIALPNYEKFSEVNSAYSGLVNNITQVINNLAS